MSTPPVTLGGLWSGFDVEGTIAKLMKLEMDQVQKVQDKKADLQTKQKAWQDINTSLSSLRASLDSLRFMGTFTARTVSFDNPAVATATAAAGTSLGSHTVNVTQLATYMTMESNANATDPNAVLQDQRYVTATPVSGSFTITVAGQSKSITVSATDTLYSLRDTIRSQAGNLVQADVVKVVNGASSTYKLVLTSKTMGAGGAVGLDDAGSGTLQALGLKSQYTSTSQNFADPNAALPYTGAGTGYGGDGAMLNISVGAQSVSIALSDGETLNSLAAKISGATGTPVRANVVTSGGNSQLVLTAMGDAPITLDDGGAGLLTQLGMTAGGGTEKVTIAAQDAVYQIDNQNYQTSSNQISDAITGVTLTLKGQGTGTMTIGQDSAPTTKAVQSWVDALNASLKLLEDDTKYDSDKKTAGVLQGDALASNLYFTLKGYISTTVGAVNSGDPTSLADVGVTTGAWNTPDWGKVLFDSSKLVNQLSRDENATARLFGALRTNLALQSNTPTASYSASDDAGPNYAAAGAFNGIMDDSRFGTLGGGWKSATVVSPTTPAWLKLDLGTTKTVDSISLYLGLNSQTTGGLKDFTVDYSTDGSSWTTLSNIQGNTQDYKYLTFNAVNARYFRVNATATNNGGDGTARVLEFQVNEYTNAPALSMYNFANNNLVTNTGPIASRDTYFNDQVKDLDTKISKMLDDMQTHETRLRTQFSAMEQAIAQIQSQGNGLLSSLMPKQ